MGLDTCERRDRVSRAAGMGVKYQEDYEYILSEAAEIRLEKAHSYGESRYEETDADFNMQGVFWDVYRKFIRLQKMFKLGWRVMAKRQPDGLRDALLDMANYCLMGVQLIDKYLGKPKKMSPFKIEQLAIYCSEPAKFKKALGLIGLDEWHEDHVVAEGTLFGKTIANQAELNFNYQLGPFELELIKYEAGKNWLEATDRGGEESPGLSHLGLHVGPDVSLDDVIAKFQMDGIHVAQQVRTQSHTNPAIKDARRYRYVIFNTRELFGFDLKLIQRLNLDGSVYRLEV